MHPPDHLISLAKVVDQVRALCDALSSGIVFLTTEENRMAQVHLSAGHVVAVICRNKRGFAAVQLMCDIHSARMHFDAGHIAASDSDELLTQVFFDYLGNTAQAPSAPSETTAPAATLPPDVKITLVKLLAKFIGPMAEIICQDHFEGATNALSVIEAIAKEIPNHDDADKFRADAKRAIG
jgi:hypothetical protein